MHTIDNLRTQLKECTERMERKSKLEAMIQTLRRELDELAEKERNLKAILARETNDVARLERISASSIIFSLLGKKEEKLDKERQEAYAAKLKYDVAVLQRADCQSRIDALTREKNDIAGVKNEYNNTFEEIKKLLHNDLQYAERLVDLERRLGETKSQLREIDEALSAGNACMNQIEHINDSLSSAEGWGRWDLWGGGLITDMEKHSHLDKAQAGAERLQMLLSRFRSELADVSISTELEQIHVDGFMRFADYFFDGLIADWTVLSHIHDAQDSVWQVKSQVWDARSRLESLRSTCERERVSLEKELASLVHGN